MQIEDILNAAKQANPEYKFSGHHHTIADRLTAVTPTSGTRLIINLPPRFSKTSLVADAFVRTYLDANHSEKAFVVCATDGLAYQMRKTAVRNGADPERYLTISIDGLAAPYTSASLIVYDDPILEQAYRASPTAREKTLERAMSAANSSIHHRLKPQGNIVAVASRAATDDFCARLNSGLPSTETYDVLSVSAIRDGHSTWPSFWGDEELKDTKAAIGYRAWSAWYMQEPLVA